MAELFKSYLYYTFHSLTKYDFMAIGWVLFLAVLLMILGAFIKRKTIAYALLFIGFLLFFAGPPAIKVAMDSYLRAAEVEVEKVKTLAYSDAAIVEGTIENRGKINFSKCDLVLIFRKPAKGGIEALSAFFKPLDIRIEPLGEALEKGSAKPFKIVVDHFSRNDFNLSVLARCYP
ncbi:DUF2393 family protein [Hydrogenimonas cancrithermarum]|uniref:DUF2393 domain-containing protein n=1 Tax=Hydrogenimonas cancrithermarum TaxID=2993563 RepID=A0ABN6WXG6_9BACT|nr:DUF2393 family protein [Hydrogenimonas cancrithermarum]BDY12750.1 hypothetical protein HCR_10620 [Hydrogenimonas cancrithermarum]